LGARPPVRGGTVHLAQCVSLLLCHRALGQSRLFRVPRASRSARTPP
jgi:hypothetical protein